MLHSALLSTPPPPPSPPSASLLSPPCPPPTIHHPRPCALTAALLTPPLRDNGSLSKKRRKKRGGRCHRIACLLTESLKAAPHKSKKEHNRHCFLQELLVPLKFPSSVPFSLSVFGGESGQSQRWRFFIRVGESWRFFLGFPHHFSFSLAIQPSPCFFTLLQPPTLDLKKKKKKDSLSLDQHNLSLCTL